MYVRMYARCLRRLTKAPRLEEAQGAHNSKGSGQLDCTRQAHHGDVHIDLHIHRKHVHDEEIKHAHEDEDHVEPIPQRLEVFLSQNGDSHDELHQKDHRKG